MAVDKMKPTPISYLVGLILTALCCNYTQAQTFGTKASAIWLSSCSQNNFYNTSGSGADLIGPVANTFDGVNLGAYTQSSGSLILRGAQVKTFKDPLVSNVCVVRMLYRVYLQSAVPGAFSTIDLPLLESCGATTYPSGGGCNPGDQKWQRIIADGETIPFTPVDLTNFTPGNYVLEVYYEATGSFTSTSGCSDLSTLNNGGANYKATFTIQQPNLLISTNPTTCSGSEGSITFNGLAANASYQITYTDDGVTTGPVALVSNGTGQVTIPGLNKGLYTNFIFGINGCTTELFTGVILSDPIFVPTFNSFPPFCAGSPAPVLPTTSNNGISGTWNPSVVNNLATGSYTFTPAAGTCGLTVTITITVIPRVAAVFPFGTTLTICGSGVVPVLPNTSSNGITGVWSPAVVDPNNSGVYIFTPTSPGCVAGTTFTVTVNPNITPTFNFPASASICTGGTVPALPGTSNNGITGTWSPAVVSNTTSGVYTFTPTAGQCAVPVSYTLTVNPIVPPTFAFGGNATICSGAIAPLLPALSSNGITGTWSPAVVSNTTSGTYTFTPTSDPCAPPATFTVTVNPNITPAFPFGTFQSVCVNATAPVLPTTSTNGITGTWSPAVVSNTVTGTYTFTPTAGQCATTTTLTYQVNPIPSLTSIRNDTTVYDGAILPPYNFSISIPGGGINWTNSNPTIGLAAQGSGTVPSFKATNMTNAPISGTITATPFVNGCLGATQTYKITVLPLEKDIFVPNVFSPNNDGKNDQFKVYGNYVVTMELHIFNQWGEHIITLNSQSQGWDGRYKGTPQPVGVYVYVLKAVLTDGTKLNKKGSITLVR